MLGERDVFGECCWPAQTRGWVLLCTRSCQQRLQALHHIQLPPALGLGEAVSPNPL